jgi:hypothetical protein
MCLLVADEGDGSRIVNVYKFAYKKWTWYVKSGIAE